MKIKETKVWNNYSAVVGSKKQNTDGQEIAGWLREVAPMLNLVELPKFRSQAIVRYMDGETLKDGNLVAIYSVSKTGLYRTWIPVNTRYFGNTGCCSTIAALSKDSLIKTILRYKDGKRVYESNADFEWGAEILDKFYKKYLNMVNTGQSGRDFATRVIEYALDVTLPENWTMDDLNKVCKTVVENAPADTYPNYMEDYKGYPNGEPHVRYATY